MELKINYLKHDYLAVLPLALFSSVGLFLISSGGLQTGSLFPFILTGMFGVLSPLLFILTLYRLIRYHKVVLTIGEQGVCFCRKDRVIRRIPWDDVVALKYTGIDGYDSDGGASDTYSIALKDARNKTLYTFQSSHIEAIFYFLRVLAHFSPELAGQVVGAGPFQRYRLEVIQDYGQELSKNPPLTVSNDINSLNQLPENQGVFHFICLVVGALLVLFSFAIFGLL